MLFLLVMGWVASSASAMDLDWGGQFRTEAHWLNNPTMTNTYNADPDRVGKGGYYIPGTGSNWAIFQPVFLRLKPKVIVNDNISIKSEFWVGDPIYGVYGSGVPYGRDQRGFNSTYNRGSTISAQRFWGEYVSDIGTVQLGRAPMHWGLGLVWNNGDGLWDRYQSTGDTVRMVSKFGAFSFVPSYVKYSIGNSLSGSCLPTSPLGGCTSVGYNPTVSDYSVAIKYENLDEELEGGVNFIRRIAGAAQDPNGGLLGYGDTKWASGDSAGRAVSMRYNTFDLFARRKFSFVTLGAEVPIVMGMLGEKEYKTAAGALESQFKIGSAWEAFLKGGLAPGQPSGGSLDPNRWHAFYFNPNYRVALIMFNYQLANLGGPNTLNNPVNSASTLRSPYDNPITNAAYLNWGGSFRTDKWNFHTNWALATARETANGQGYFFNTWTRQNVANAGGQKQESWLGWEMDYGATFHWDESFVFGGDFGFFFPGSYYRFSNTSKQNAVGFVFASVIKAGVNF